MDIIRDELSENFEFSQIILNNQRMMIPKMQVSLS